MAVNSPLPVDTEPVRIDSPCDGPCGKPCGDGGDCGGSGDCGGPAPSVLSRTLFEGFVNALDLCFDEVLKEPAKILMIGGCRQRDFAQYMALLLPGSDIALIDPDPREAQKAREEVCCRFKFLSGAIERMPFETGEFDLVLAHNLPEFTRDPDVAVDEIARVTSRDRGNFLITHHRPRLWQIARYVPGMRKAVRETGTRLPERLPLPEELEVMDRLPRMIKRHAEIGLRLSPFPWRLYMTQALTG